MLGYPSKVVCIDLAVPHDLADLPNLYLRLHLLDEAITKLSLYNANLVRELRCKKLVLRRYEFG